MIINFSFTNWMSFRNKTDFSMLATREKQHSDQLAVLKEYQRRILPVAALYGGNASGKSNFCSALSFVKDLVVADTRSNQQIAVKPFLLDTHSADEPCCFELVILADETIYEFSFSLTPLAMIEEKLVKIGSSSEKVLYHRQQGEPISLDDSFKGDEKKRLEFVFQGTRENQLFLTNSISQQVNTFQAVYDWFAKHLEIIFPNSKTDPLYPYFLAENNSIRDTINQLLPELDMGMSRLDTEIVAPGKNIIFNDISYLKELKRLEPEIKQGTAAFAYDHPNGEKLLFKGKDGKINIDRLGVFHLREDGGEIQFNFDQESDGSQRIIGLLPALIAASSSGSQKVLLIDEMDRSLHTQLTRSLLEYYLSSCNADRRTQLLITIHDVMLMDQTLFRRDAMWVAERNQTGSSRLMPFSDYKDIRYDKDIRKSYLRGRLGGIPKILLDQAATH